jgi:hypothetical protein
MEHREFWIGVEFWCGGHRWPCTDVGSQTIAAISLEPRELGEISDAEDNVPLERRNISSDPSWLLRPPYKVAEVLFDEYDIEGCSPTKIDDVVCEGESV